MKRIPLILTAVLLGVFSSPEAHAQFQFDTGTTTFTPSFRDGANTDLGNTSYFGWETGNFDGGTNNELMESPTPNLGSGGATGTLDQLGTADLLASFNSIYIGANGRTDTLRLVIPTNGTPGSSGYTTLIIQGLTYPGAPSGNLLVNKPVFPDVNGVTPTYVFGLNAYSASSQFQGQWFVKYELPGNQSSYTLDIGVTNSGGNTVPLTIDRLEVDSVYSTTSYAPDTAVVPEPSTYALLGLGLAAIWGGRFRRIA